MRCSTLLGILTGVLLYLVMGAVVFRTLEMPQEEGQHSQLQDTRRDFLFNFTCVGPDNLQALIEEVADAIGAGVDPASTANASIFITKWDLASAFFFSGTIITTIGFGNISPKTEGGQLFCICYALVGIPLFGILLAGVGDHLGTWLRKVVAKIETLFLKWRVSPTIVRVISAVLSIMLGCVLFVFVPIVVFQEVEGWTLLESAYFVVITLTTVGFGDYVAGDSGVAGSDHWYKPLVWFWILLGLAYFASILAMIGNWLRVLSKNARAEMEGLRAHAAQMDFHMPDDPFKRRHRKKHRHRDRSKGHSASVEENGKLPNGPGGSGSSSSGSSSYTSNESDDSGSESGSQVTQSERVPEVKVTEVEQLKAEPAPDPLFSQPLDYFGENLAFIDESSDAVSGKLHLDPLLDAVPDYAPPPRPPQKRRRQRRRSPPQKSVKSDNGGERNGERRPSLLAPPRA